MSFCYLPCSEDCLNEVKPGDIEKNVMVAHSVMKRVLEASASGLDVSYLFADFVKLLASTHFFIKKLASWCICNNVPSDSELIILVGNTLVKDSQDPNPLVRGLALRILGSVSSSALTEHKIQALTTSLDDSDPYVRRAAVLACSTLLQDIAIDRGRLVNRLYSMIRDRDPVVVANSLVVLQCILQYEGGVVINRNIARHLLQQLNEFSEPQFLVIVRLLMKYRPRDEQDALEAMNFVDPCIKFNSAAVVIHLVEYLLFLVTESKLKHLCKQVVLRTRSHLLHTLASDIPEMSYATVNFITERLVPEFSDVFQTSDHHGKWFCRHSDPSYLKIARIQLLPKVTSCSDVISTVQELTSYFSDGCQKVAVTAVEAVGKLLKTHPVSAAECSRIVLSVINSTTDEDIMTSTLSIVLRSFQDYIPDEKVIQIIIQCRALTDPTAAKERTLCVLLSMLARYESVVNNLSFIIERVLDSIMTPSSELMSVVLSCLFRLLISRPAENQDLLGRAIELGVLSDDADVQDKAVFYYTVLHFDSATLSLSRKIASLGY